MPDPTTDHKAKTEALRAKYADLFNSANGKDVLADLLAQFGFEQYGPVVVEKPTAVPGLRSEEVWLRDGAKQPIRRILMMMNQRETEPKPTTALSA